MAADQVGQVAGAIAQQGRRLPLQSRQHDLAGFLFGAGLQAARIDDLEQVSVFPQMQAGLVEALEGDAGAVHFAQAVRVVRLDPEQFFDLAAGLFRMRFGPDKGFCRRNWSRLTPSAASAECRCNR